MLLNQISTLGGSCVSAASMAVISSWRYVYSGTATGMLSSFGTNPLKAKGSLSAEDAGKMPASPGFCVIVDCAANTSSFDHPRSPAGTIICVNSKVLRSSGV
jgi:hypothetical protein